MFNHNQHNEKHSPASTYCTQGNSICIHMVCLLTFRESDITKERIQKILSAGANVVLTSGGIDDLCLKYFVEAGAMAVRRCKKEDLKRIARATGGDEFCGERILIYF